MVADEHTFWFAYKFVLLILASYQYVNKARLSHSVKTRACNKCHFFPRLLTNMSINLERPYLVSRGGLFPDVMLTSGQQREKSRPLHIG